ncbi:MAG: energy transducer TonB [Enhydrobacter sp.]|nr:MAG: energy transducer TonB [Enhydrobacter sp.]
MQDHPRPAEIEEKQQQQEPSRQEALAAPPSPPPEPKVEPKPEPKVEPKPEPKVEPKPEQALPPVEPPPAPPRAQDLAAVAPKPPPHPPQPPPPKPQQPRPPAANSALRPSPLSEHSRPSPDPRAAAAPSATFVNPADQAHRTRVTDQYVWQVVRKMSQYLPDLRVKGQVGTVVLRLVIDRSGRLIDASVAQSSGHTVLDKALLETIRAAAPYAPLPPELPGDRVTLNVPVGSAYR